MKNVRALKASKGFEYLRIFMAQISEVKWRRDLAQRVSSITALQRNCLGEARYNSSAVKVAC